MDPEVQKQLRERFMFAVRLTITAVTHFLDNKTMFPNLAETQKELIFESMLNGWLSALPMTLAEEVKSEVLGKMVTESIQSKKSKASSAFELIQKVTEDSEIAMLMHQIGWDSLDEPSPDL